MTSTLNPPPNFKEEVLLILSDWQAEVAADRGVNPTEANGAALRSINIAINTIQQI
jgi:hypothetical protein